MLQKDLYLHWCCSNSNSRGPQSKKRQPFCIRIPQINKSWWDIYAKCKFFEISKYWKLNSFLIKCNIRMPILCNFFGYRRILLYDWETLLNFLIWSFVQWSKGTHSLTQNCIEGSMWCKNLMKTNGAGFVLCNFAFYIPKGNNRIEWVLSEC